MKRAFFSQVTNSPGWSYGGTCFFSNNSGVRQEPLEALFQKHSKTSGTKTTWKRTLNRLKNPWKRGKITYETASRKHVILDTLGIACRATHGFALGIALVLLDDVFFYCDFIREVAARLRNNSTEDATLGFSMEIGFDQSLPPYMVWPKILVCLFVRAHFRWRHR